jgi:hypothetical protein
MESHHNVNYEPTDSSVSYTSGNSITTPLTPLLPSYKPPEKRYYEISPSSILIPQHSTDSDGCTYGEMTSIPKYTNTLDNEKTVHATPIPYVSEL